MATVTHLVTTPDTGNTPNTSGAFVPTSGSLLVVFVTKEASVPSAMVSGDLTSSVGMTFSLIRAEGFSGASAHTLGLFIANALTSNTASQTVTLGSGGDAGGGSIISVYEVSGMTFTGADADRQTGGESDQASGEVPSVNFDVGVALTGNPIIGAVGVADGTPALTAPASFSESQDTGYTTGTAQGLETVIRNSGHTSQTVAWQTATTGGSYATIVVELDTTASTPAVIPLAAADALATATVALTAATQVPLATAEAAAAATLALTAPTEVPLQSATAVSSATLTVITALSTGTGLVQLGALDAPEAGTQTLRVRARAASGDGVLRVTLYDTDGVTVRGTDDFTLTGSFQTFELEPSGVTDWSALQVGFEGRTQTALTAEVSWVELQVPQAGAAEPAIVPLQAASAQSSATLALTAPTQVPLDAAAAQSSATLALAAPAEVTLGAAAAQSSATVALTAPTTVPLGAATGQGSASLAVTAQTYVLLGASTAQSSATITVTAGPGVIPTQPASAQSDASLAVTAPTEVPLQASTGTATASLVVSTPTQTFIALDPATGQATGQLTLQAATQVPLQTSVGLSDATLTLFAPSEAIVALGAATATATATLALVPLGNRWPPQTDTRWDVDSQTGWPADTDSNWGMAASGRWDVDPESNW